MNQRTNEWMAYAVGVAVSNKWISFIDILDTNMNVSLIFFRTYAPSRVLPPPYSLSLHHEF